jgi:hypothetical protein
MAPREEADTTELVDFELDLTAHELSRRAHVLEAVPDWDPIAVLEGERAAWELLMSDLDPEQRAIHRMLVEAGVLDA